MGANHSIQTKDGANPLLGLVVLIILVSVSRDVGGPEGEVITEELHDDGGVLVRVLRKVVELSDGIVESLLGELAGLVGRSHDLVVEDGEVQGETKTDGVSGRELVGNVGGSLVGC